MICKVYKNGNIQASIGSGVISQIKAEAPEEQLKHVWKHLSALLDYETDTLEAETAENAEVKRMFSFQTQKEYVVTKENLGALLRGETIRLKGFLASKEVKSQFMWDPFAVAV
jgi:primosomal replication protein N